MLCIDKPGRWSIINIKAAGTGILPPQMDMLGE